VARIGRRWLLAAVATVLVPGAVAGQQRLATYPGYDRFVAGIQTRAALRERLAERRVRGEWTDGGGAYVYEVGGERRRWRAAGGTVEVLPADAPGGGEAAGRGRRPARGRQYTEVEAPDGSATAIHRDRNVVVRRRDGTEVPVTTAGDAARRTKFGTASWVYGEELDQNTAMWWSPDGDMLAYYGFDEGAVRDYHLQLDQTRIHSSLDVEAYPKAGTPNPVVSLHVWHADTGETVELDVRSGAPFAAETVGYYVYGVEWTPDGSEVLIHRTNRLQNVMELAACDPAGGGCRTVVREAWPTGWVENSPEKVWLADGKRFIWASEASGYRNYHLYHLSGEHLATLTDHDVEVAGIEHVDEASGSLWYMARSGDNHMKLQLHRVGLDGRGDVRLTDPSLHHTVQVSPDGRHVVDVAEAHDRVPVTRILDADGRPRTTLSPPASRMLAEAGLHPVELFDFVAADGETRLHGMLHRPADFDPARAYPLLVSVYAGPATNGARERFTAPHPYTELGFVVARLDARSAAGRGKRALDAIYRRLGVVEVDDQAAGVRALARRPWIDGNRVGIHGTSYGGYVSIMALLRHPDVFAAASASSPVTDWRHYDTIYTERYMRTPQENPEGYDAGSAITWVDALEGDLMLWYGTADNNVHPSNMMQLIAALQEAGKSFEVQVGPDRGHSAIPGPRMMEFFIENLVLRP
jgi:dipeptidyl-peptidase-4